MNRPAVLRSFGTLTLVIILLIGALLRFYKFFELPFTFDELGAIDRLHHNTFSELIEKGIKIDFHPAGVQVFLYYWCKIVGEQEWVVKLPFILLGIGSIYLAFTICKNWFTETAGLVAAAFIATLQFTVSYSTMARPYVAGLFFTLLMVHFWTNYFITQKRNKDLIGFVLAAAACCYVHHFSLLFAGIVGLTGFLFVNKSNWKAYLAGNAAVLVLYLPHLKILLHQLSKGGIGGADGWLNAPENNFLFRFVAYTFYYSYLAGGFVVLLTAFYFFYGKKIEEGKNKLRIICVIWFLVPFLIAFFYSRLVNPILQYSTLIFSFPYFVFLVSSFITETRKLIVSLILVLLVSVNAYSLIYIRNNYEILLHQPASEYVKYIKQLQETHPDQRVYAILGTTETPFIQYYQKKYSVKFPFHEFRQKSDPPAALNTLVIQEKPDYLVTGFLPAEYNAFFREEFPFQVYHAEGFTYDINCFSRQQNKTEEIPVAMVKFAPYKNSTDFNHLKRPWYGDSSLIRTDTISPNKYMLLDSLHEWGPGFKGNLDEFVSKKNSVLLASIHVKPAGPSKDGMLVLELAKGDSTYYWRGSNLSDYYVDGREWQTLSVSCNLIDALKSNQRLSDFRLSIYFWNIKKQKVYLDNFSFDVLQGNPLVYGLFENIE